MDGGGDDDDDADGGRRWRPLFELFHSRRPRTGAECVGVVRSVSSSTPHCVVEDDADGRLVPCALPWERHFAHLREVVEGAAALRVVARALEGVVQSARLEVDDAALAAELRAEGHLRGEVHAVGLLVGTWKDITLLAAAADDDDDDDEGANAGARRPTTRATSPWRTPPRRVPARPPAARRRPDARARAATTLAYAGNYRRAVARGHRAECLTDDPSWREAAPTGGILGDRPGPGKTLTTPWHHRHRRRRRAGGAGRARHAVVLPLNLHAQWVAEARRFLAHARVANVMCGRDPQALRPPTCSPPTWCSPPSSSSASRAPTRSPSRTRCRPRSASSGARAARAPRSPRAHLARPGRRAAVSRPRRHRVAIDEAHECSPRPSARRALAARATAGA